MTGKSRRKAYLLASLAVLFWATSPTAFKLGLRFQDSYQLLTGASITSAIVLGLIIAIQGKFRLLAFLGWKDIGFSVIMGLLNPVAYYLILFKAYTILPAQIAQPLNMVWPIVLVLISIPLLGQKINRYSILAMIISFSGVVVLSLQGGSGERSPENRLGIILALSTSIIWAFYFIQNARNNTDPVVRLFLNFLFAAGFLLAGGMLKEQVLPDTAQGWYSAIYVGVFEMGITFVLWLMALRYAPTTDRISNLVFMAPFLNLIFVNLVLDEKIFMTTIYGIMLLVSGILIQNFIGKYEKIN